MDLQTHILIVDDDPGIRNLLGEFLVRHGFRVETAGDASALRTRLGSTKFDLVVLDVMMPGEDGLSVLRTLDPAARPPVILLSAMGSDVDRIVGLELGADDYLAKPCNPRELLARIRTVLRRAGQAPAATAAGLRFEGWHIDPVSRDIRDPAGEPVTLTDGEFRLLLTFVRHPRRVLSRDFLLEHVRGSDTESFDRTIDVLVSRLRRRLDRPGSAAPIRTVRLEGYMFACPVTAG